MKYIMSICVVYIIFSITLFNEASTRTLNISSEREREREGEREAAFSVAQVDACLPPAFAGQLFRYFFFRKGLH